MNVQLSEGGLFANLHFNPRHVLAEQLIWDAENAPQNVGFSHARADLIRRNGREVVESIDKVLSVDLVANPATTGGLRVAQRRGYGPTRAAGGRPDDSAGRHAV